jgi:hypothetical protein
MADEDCMGSRRLALAIGIVFAVACKGSTNANSEPVTVPQAGVMAVGGAGATAAGAGAAAAGAGGAARLVRATSICRVV